MNESLFPVGDTEYKKERFLERKLRKKSNPETLIRRLRRKMPGVARPNAGEDDRSSTERISVFRVPPIARKK